MNKIVLSILCIISLAAFNPAQAAWYDWIPGVSWFTGKKAQNQNQQCLNPNISIHVELQSKSDFETRYDAVLKDNATGKKLGYVAYTCDKINKSGAMEYISNLDVSREEHFYRNILLKHALEKLNIHNCNKIIFYDVVLKDNATGKNLGYIVFSYNKINKSGSISNLYVLPEERGHFYGSILFNIALERLSTHKSNKICWSAIPTDFNANQTQEEMLPKLITFYQRHGARLIRQTNAANAQMVYYPTSTPRSPIANIKLMHKWSGQQTYPASTSTRQSRQFMRLD